MMNLFSSFNPTTSQNSSMNWMVILIPMMILLTPMWKINSSMSYSFKLLNMFMMTQFKSSMKKSENSNMIMVMMIMMLLFPFNTIGLMPDSFSSTSHIMINLSLALVMWLNLMMKKSINMKHLLCSLTPSNTPGILIPFMVLIELTSLLIQPMTLTIRLTANVMAGHIMMILISQLYQITFLPTLIMNLMMMILELGVSIIQAYVFSMLIIMYSK